MMEQGERVKRGAVTRDVRASVPPVTAPLVWDPDSRRCIQIEPVRPPRRNGCTTLHRQKVTGRADPRWQPPAGLRVVGNVYQPNE
jgi:hypothetical protein